ncbi:tRNA-specific 2-thiouridylase MnmA [invertebrate metagenome]|uniref:tRNA-specific 2-thiouridylase MnmA n=1 Tax=invertebrate metagenome TaxID=1711999 RepID=A0A484HC83_9ZZZZ
MRNTNKGRVVVAMSGGVDSSVTAALLEEEGRQVIGVTLQLGGAMGHRTDERPCCTGRDVADARQVAAKIGIPHYVFDYERRFFDDVVLPFAESYGRGETPVPCVLCNKTVKFRDLLAAARLLEAECLATGHYARRQDGPDGPELWRGRDSRHDQSYFLFATTRAQLSFLHFPLGKVESKAETRAHARRFGLPVADKHDSQDICFAPEGDYSRVISTIKPEVVKPGDIVHIDGSFLGKHAGIVHYTINQRRGLGIGGRPEPLYVVRLEPATRRVIVGPRSALLRDWLIVGDINWLGAGTSPPAAGMAIKVQLRSTHAPLSAIVFGYENGSARVQLARPFAGVAPGQACVFYQGDRILGGGWITK